MTDPAAAGDWVDVGATDTLRDPPLRQIRVGAQRVALSFRNGVFGAISDRCNHVGGPLGAGRLDGDYVVCPWHAWKFHRCSGDGEPGYEADHVPHYDVRERGGRLEVRATPASKRTSAPHPPHPLARRPQRAAGPPRVVGISTTSMTPGAPRYSTSEALLETALQQAAADGAETRLIRLRDLAFRHCEGYYSKSAKACTWPCSITQADPADELTPVYEALVHWADVALIATPIRWGAAASLYFKMAERLNCVQNHQHLHGESLIQQKVAAFIVTGGQDNVQAVVGQMLGFFAELGFVFPPFPFVAHSLGWTAENMERNVAYVQASASLHAGVGELATRSLSLSRQLLATTATTAAPVARGGRKAHRDAGDPAVTGGDRRG
jgi:multimeric flavodoxin WrbA/nitrite reductase/ring-hydroxylating ferredoxin subunit